MFTVYHNWWSVSLLIWGEGEKGEKKDVPKGEINSDDWPLNDVFYTELLNGWHHNPAFRIASSFNDFLKVKKKNLIISFEEVKGTNSSIFSFRRG